MQFEEYYQLDRSWRATVVWGAPTTIEQLICELERHLPGDWSRNHQAEQNYRVRGGLYPGSVCFARSTTEGEVWLWLNRLSPNRFQGGNVIPVGDVKDYERLVGEAIRQFLNDVIRPAAEASGAKVVVNKIGPSSQVSADVLEALWSFCDQAERTFPLQPASRPLWRKFIVTACSSRTAFDEVELAEWFSSQGWSEPHARDLADKFFEDAWLLSDYDAAKQPA